VVRVTIPVWLFVVLVLLSLEGIAVTVLGLLVLMALGAHYRPDQVTPLTDDALGLLIEGPWHPSRHVEGGH
jgi:hypothetical protein